MSNLPDKPSDLLRMAFFAFMAFVVYLGTRS